MVASGDRSARQWLAASESAREIEKEREKEMGNGPTTTTTSDPSSKTADWAHCLQGNGARTAVGCVWSVLTISSGLVLVSLSHRIHF